MKWTRQAEVFKTGGEIYQSTSKVTLPLLPTLAQFFHLELGHMDRSVSV